MLHLIHKHIRLEHAKLLVQLKHAEADSDEANSLLVRMDVLEDAGLNIVEILAAMGELAEANDSLQFLTSAQTELHYEVNRAYCQALDDFSFPPFDEAEEWQLNSIRNGIAIGPQSPRQSHESWMAEKVADGWKYGPVKDPVMKTHPCIQPYGQLHYKQRAKDHIFQSIVRICHESTYIDEVQANSNNDVSSESTESADNT
jgi:hypothetical protein